MGDNEGCAVFSGVCDGAAHGVFTFTVERAGGFIKQQNRRVAHKGAGERDALALPAGQAAAFLAKIGFEPVFLRQEIIGFGHAGGFDEVGFGDVMGGANGDVSGGGSGKQGGFLRGVGKLFPPVGRVGVCHANTVERDLTGLYIKQAQSNAKDCGLACAAGADERDELTGRNIQSEVVQSRKGFVGIFEGDVLKVERARNGGVEADRGFRRGDIGMRIEHFCGAVCGACGAHDLSIDFGQHAKA